jgi:N-acyl-D-amino-acid deacylase
MTIVRNAVVYDGTGSGGFAGWVAVEGDRIVDVAPGDAPDGLADAEVIDAGGAFLTPGFIDAHAHSDAYLAIEGSAASKITQAVTTEINGQCGGSAVPRYGEARLSSDWAAVLGDRLVWRSLAEYREALGEEGIAVNTVQFIGHNTLRSSVMGYAARAAGEDELRAMERLLAESLDAGGWGFSTGLIYQPGRYAAAEEVERLAGVAAARDGFYSTHMRSEGDFLLESIDEVIDLSRKTGIRSEISHLKTSGERNWGKLDAALEKISAAVAAGELLGADRYPFCAAGTDLDIVLPDWAQAGAAEAEMRRFADASTRARIIRELDESGRDWSKVMIGGVWSAGNLGLSGKSVAEIAGGSPGETVVGILERDGCKTGAFFFGMSEKGLERILAEKWVVPGSDASLRVPWGKLGKDHPHPRAYATMPEFYRRTLAALGGESKRAETIARMTGEVARRFGIQGRGVVAKGAFADIAVWREDAFCAEATYERPHRYSSGVDMVMVNGVVVYRHGEFTGRRPGRFLERGR